LDEVVEGVTFLAILFATYFLGGVLNEDSVGLEVGSAGAFALTNYWGLRKALFIRGVSRVSNTRAF